jgi:hypothetical protein
MTYCLNVPNYCQNTHTTVWRTPSCLNIPLNGETLYTYSLKTKSLQFIYFIVHVDYNITGTLTHLLKKKVDPESFFYSV